MSGRPIQAGDLVYVAHPCPCCGDAGVVGWMFTVHAIQVDIARCPIANRTIGPEPFASFTLPSGRPGLVTVRDLRRIEPPSNRAQAPRRDQVAA
jgi:hypothetical protein